MQASRRLRRTGELGHAARTAPRARERLRRSASRCRAPARSAGRGGSRRRSAASPARGRSAARAGRSAGRRRSASRRTARRRRRGWSPSRGRAPPRPPRRRRRATRGPAPAAPRCRSPQPAPGRATPITAGVGRPRRLGQPRERGRLGRVLARPARPGASSRTRCGRRRARHRVGVVDVAAGHRLQRLRGDAGRRADRGLEGHARARSSASRPRQAASTRSSTSSKPSLAAVVRVGHVEVGRAGRRRVELAQQPHLLARLLVRRQRPQVARGSRGRRRAAGRSRRSRDGRTWRAAPSSTIPRRCAAAVARASGGSPACQPPVPALSISISSSSPACAQQRPHHALRGRGAADVAHAHEEDLHGVDVAEGERRSLRARSPGGDA